MAYMGLKLGIAGVVLAGAVGYLAMAGAQKGWVYTLGVDTYLARAEQQGQRVRLCGLVGDKDLTVEKAKLTAVFVLKGEKGELPVKFKGVVPDLFKAGCEVLVEGKRDGAGIFQADVMMTKCASKYDEAPAGHPTSRKYQPETQPGAGTQPPVTAPGGGV